MQLRYKVLHDFENYKEGQVITSFSLKFDKLPFYFKKLKWYEERMLDENWSSFEDEPTKNNSYKYHAHCLQINQSPSRTEKFVPDFEIPTINFESVPKTTIAVTSSNLPSYLTTSFKKNTNPFYKRKIRFVETYHDGSYSKLLKQLTGRTDVVAFFRVKHKRRV